MLSPTGDPRTIEDMIWYIREAIAVFDEDKHMDHLTPSGIKLSSIVTNLDEIITSLKKFE